MGKLKKELKKTDKEFQFFQDFWKFRKKYHDADGEPDEWYTELVNVGDTIIKKYENTEFAEFAKAVVLAHLEDIDVRVRKRRK